MGRATSNAESAEHFAHGLSAKFLQCRELGHTWRSWTVEYDKKARAYLRQLRCAGCHTIRQQTLDRRGHVITNSYRYPDGYMARSLQPGTYSRDVFRLESITRFLEQRKAS